MKKTISLILVTELIILVTNIISFEFFINLQIAFLSSFFVIHGSMYAYNRMIKSQVSQGNIDEQRDPLDTIEDPHGLYENDVIDDTPVEELDLKAIVKEEKKKIKILNLKDIKKGSRASVSFYRLAPYLFLIMGFIALRNNELLNIAIYLPSLLGGIVIGYISSKGIYKQ